MEKLTASDICKIIKSCRDNKVSRFCLNGLKLEFNPEPEVVEKEIIRDLHIQTPEPLLEKNISKQRQLEIREELLHEARLANPSLYEELIGQEELDGEDA